MEEFDRLRPDGCLATVTVAEARLHRKSALPFQSTSYVIAPEIGGVSVKVNAPSGEVVTPGIVVLVPSGSFRVTASGCGPGAEPSAGVSLPIASLRPA